MIDLSQHQAAVRIGTLFDGLLAEALSLAEVHEAAAVV